jgi:hypothetical protein
MTRILYKICWRTNGEKGDILEGGKKTEDRQRKHELWCASKVSGKKCQSGLVQSEFFFVMGLKGNFETWGVCTYTYEYMYVCMYVCVKVD